jgi:hypothetical protein
MLALGTLLGAGWALPGDASAQDGSCRRPGRRVEVCRRETVRETTYVRVPYRTVTFDFCRGRFVSRIAYRWEPRTRCREVWVCAPACRDHSTPSDPCERRGTPVFHTR